MFSRIKNIFTAKDEAQPAKPHAKPANKKSQHQHSVELVQDTKRLREVVKELLREKFISIDTEFHRERTYFPDLCLIQLAGEEHAYIIDPLAPGIDILELKPLLKAPRVLKVFHSCGQDMEIMLHRFDLLPDPVFDTQVAAKMLGYGEAVSYAKLVQKICHADLDKTSRVTDWTRRPLEKSQLSYAVADVTYLRKVYEQILHELQQKKRVQWYQEEMELLLDPEVYQNNPEESWQRLKLRSQDPQYLAVIKSLASWREVRAQQQDVPRGRVMRDEALLEIAAAKPKNADAMKSLRFARQINSPAVVQEILNALDEGRNAPPVLVDDPAFMNVNPAVLEMLRILLKMKCDLHHIAPSVVAKSDDLKIIAAEDQPNVPAMKGWRYDLFGQYAMALKQGKVALTAEGRKLKLIELDRMKPVAEHGEK